MKYTTIFVALISMLISGTVLAEGGSTLERIKENETIRIGYRESEPPMSFLNKDKQPVGYSIDLCRLIVNEIKSHLQNPNIATRYVPVNSVDRFEALQNDSIDILCGATTKTLSRLEQVDFTQMTFITGAALMTLGPVKLKEFTELNGKKVAVKKGTTTVNSLKRALKKSASDAIIVTVNTSEEGLDAVVQGQVHAFAADQIVLIGQVVTHENPKKFAISDNVFSYEPFALAVRRNDADFRLLADRVLSRLYRSGKIKEIYNQWFGKYITKVPDLLNAMYIMNSTPE